MNGWLPFALAGVFAIHVAAFSIAGLRKRRRGQPGARYAILVVAFSLLTLSQVASIPAVRESALVPGGSADLVTWAARVLFAVALAMLLAGLLRRRA